MDPWRKQLSKRKYFKSYFEAITAIKELPYVNKRFLILTTVVPNFHIYFTLAAFFWYVQLRVDNKCFWACYTACLTNIMVVFRFSNVFFIFTVLTYFNCPNVTATRTFRPPQPANSNSKEGQEGVTFRQKQYKELHFYKLYCSLLCEIFPLHYFSWLVIAKPFSLLLQVLIWTAGS